MKLRGSEDTLPKWARDELKLLRGKIDALRKLTEEQPVSSVYVEHYHLEARKYLKDRDAVSFDIGPTFGSHIVKVSLIQDNQRLGTPSLDRALYITATGRFSSNLVVMPDSSNVLFLGVKDL